MTQTTNQSVGKAIITPPTSADDYLQIDNLAKSYGIVKALKGVKFGIKKGEVHTLLGENGAGKSTLVKIIMGEETPDSGQIIIDNRIIEQYNPLYAAGFGISMVHQELAVFENMTVAENIFPVGDYLTKWGSVDWATLNRKAEESIKVFGMNLSATQRMDSLTLAQQQMVEILRCISGGQQLILLDEPTSGLNNEESDRLMEVIRKLCADGITVIYISHRINEIMSISDRITVMKDGEYVCTFQNDENLTEDDLVGKMVGYELSENLYAKKDFVDASQNPVMFEVKDLCKKNGVRDISLSLHEGEIVGVFGLEGSGSNQFSRMLYGLSGKESGEVHFKGQKLDKLNPTDLIEKKILYLNNNRKKAGLLLDSPACDNMILPVMKGMSDAGMLNSKRIADYTNKYIDTFSIVIPSIFQKPRNLSGGNQQKLMLSMCLGTAPEMFIVNEPTRGIDVGAKAEIHRFLLGISQQGVGLLIFSSELPELMALCDRIVVMNQGRVAGELCGDAITEEAVVALAAGSMQKGGAK